MRYWCDLIAASSSGPWCYFAAEMFESSNCYLPEGNEAIDCEVVVGRGSEQYLLGRLSTIA